MLSGPGRDRRRGGRCDGRAPALPGGSRIDLAGIQHSFEGRPPLFAPIDLALEPGISYAVTGPSGTGKSTLLGIIAGWIDPRSGSITRTAVTSVAWVFQNPHGSPRRTALDHVVLPLVGRGLARTEAEADALEILGGFALAGVADRPFGRLSGGEAQRLMLARAVASRPALLLVDEPTAQLDAATGATVNEVLGTVTTGGSIVVVATHDARTAAACDVHLELSPA